MRLRRVCPEKEHGDKLRRDRGKHLPQKTHLDELLSPVTLPASPEIQTTAFESPASPLATLRVTEETQRFSIFARLLLTRRFQSVAGSAARKPNSTADYADGSDEDYRFCFPLIRDIRVIRGYDSRTLAVCSLLLAQQFQGVAGFAARKPNSTADYADGTDEDYRFCFPLIRDIRIIRGY